MTPAYFPSVFVRVYLAASITFCLAFAVRGQEQEVVGIDAGIEFFEKQIRPILVRHCHQCHSANSGESEGGLLLDSPQGWLQGGDHGPSIVVGDSESSLLIRAIRYGDEELQMPPTKPLLAGEVALLEQWIMLGAPAPSQPYARPSDDPSDPIVGKEHWAFRALSKAAFPKLSSQALNDRDWPTTAIDAFVIGQLETQGLRPVGDAEPRILARRLYVQLTGIPPTPDELHEFLSDPDPQAYERLVDRLLASPHFGEHWGRHWLDLARYADSNGLDENFLFREAWRYRNWVIEAINSDMPFDRFVTMQLAGDLLSYDTIEQRDRQRIASGFLLIGPKVLLGNNAQNQRMEVADEQIDTVGRALLGQTLGCARCHNHKFDPVPTADYYALAGIFASTQVMERRYMLGEQRVMEQLIGLGDEGRTADEAYEEYWRERPQLVERKKKAEEALALLKQNDEIGDSKFAELVEKQGDSIADDAKDLSLSLELRTTAQEAWVESLNGLLSAPPPIPPRAMVSTDVEHPADEHVRIAGAFDQLGEKVPRGFLTVLIDHERRELASNTSGRLELAEWLTDGAERSGQLAARVLANRIWHHLIGRGLVRTVDNFGRTGESPSHPELLDYLASELLASRWSIKSLVRDIVTSRTFKLSSHRDASNYGRDPENLWLWRAHRRRLTPESFRDAMLSAANALDRTPLDSTVAYLGDQATAVGTNPVRRRTDYPNRSVYLPVIRNDLPELFEIFDFANPHTTTGLRPNTTVPTQGLFMLNDEVVMEAAKTLAQRVIQDAASGDHTAQVETMYELMLNAVPTAVELQTLEEYIKQCEVQMRDAGDPEPELRALTLACHAIFATSRFQFLE